MAQYLGTVKLGGFYNNGAILKRPTKPWQINTTPPGASAVSYTHLTLPTKLEV